MSAIITEQQQPEADDLFIDDDWDEESSAPEGVASADIDPQKLIENYKKFLQALDASENPGQIQVTYPENDDGVVRPTILSQEELELLFSREKDDPQDPGLKIFLSFSRAMNHGIQPGKNGLVIGVGKNSDYYRKLNWMTLDIRNNVGADIVADANQLSRSANNLDYIFAECIDISLFGTHGVSLENLLTESNKALTEGGIFAWKTVDLEGTTRTLLPRREVFAREMQRHGFQAIIVYQPLYEGHKGRDIYYIGKKIR